MSRKEKRKERSLKKMKQKQRERKEERPLGSQLGKTAAEKCRSGGQKERKDEQRKRLEDWKRGLAKKQDWRKEKERSGRRSTECKTVTKNPEATFGLSLGAAATAPGVFSIDGGTSVSTPDDTCSSGVGRAVESKKVEGCAVFHVGSTLGDMLTWLDRSADEFFGQLCKTMPSGRVFPLPSSPDLIAECVPEETEDVRCALRVVVKSLNSLNGEGNQCVKVASDYQRKILKGLGEDCSRVCSWQFETHPPTWDEFFRVRGVDYKGDEILTAQSMRWENVAPALPREVGGVELDQVVELGCKYYVQNFEEFLLDPKDQIACRPPKVMVPSEAWPTFCRELLDLGVFSRVHESDLYRVGGQPLVNGLFGVSKNEFHGPHEIYRIIMNMIPLNGICRGFDGDISTLPSWAGMTPLNLSPHENLVVSSEDVRCFFYIFRVPISWHRFMAFNKELPKELCGDRPGKWYPCSAVLPMGFKNSVSLAQHVHRFIVQSSLKKVGEQGGEAELRKDRPFTSSNPMYRIYLDNFDQLEKISSELVPSLKGSVSPLIQGLRDQYAELGVPRHPKKGVARQTVAEVQGAIVDGVRGIAHPKVEKVLKYVHLAILLLQASHCTQKQAQVVGGGLVYMAMFRRPLLGGLNHIWQFIVGFEGLPPVVKLPIPDAMKAEIARFVGMIPLAYMNFRGNVSPLVTASDASEFGGGATVSEGLTPMGVAASQCRVRGDIVEPEDLPTVLTIGLFDGIGALRVAVDSLGWAVSGHISVEKSAEARRVVESHFGKTVTVSDVAEIDSNLVKEWSQQFTQVSLVVVGSGPPCQGVSGLNASRRGALKDERSCLFQHVPRIVQLVRRHFPWAQVRSLMESVASMDLQDQEYMSQAVGLEPLYIDASGVSLAHRPRLYWLDWEILESPDAIFGETPAGRQSVELHASLDPKAFLEPGWSQTAPGSLPTFTTSRPRDKPGYKPAGLAQCSADDKQRWTQDSYRFPPYQYKECHCLVNAKGILRIPSVVEREVIMGFPKGYTVNCLPKKDQGTQRHTDCRLTLIGNSWNVTVVAWLLSHLGAPLGLNPSFSVEEIVQRTSPGKSTHLQTFLQRPSLQHQRGKKSTIAQSGALVRKLLSLVSIKGEDLLLQNASEDLVKYHRRRASIPARLWKWKTVASWKWTGQKEHINVLELRAVLTTLRWRLERHKQVNHKFVHLVDSMVTLHALSRGRSSSRKLRRTLLRVNALLLATRSQGVWTYVHTKQNPADAPSRRPLKRKWSACQKGI